MVTSAEIALGKAGRALVRAFAEKNPQKIAGFFAEDGLAMYPIPHPRIGRLANQKAWVSYFEQYATHPLNIENITVAESGDLGYIFGCWATLEMDEPDALVGRYVAIWRYSAGRWEIAVLSAHVHHDVQPFPFHGQ